jgi:hypothetical protein
LIERHFSYEVADVQFDLSSPSFIFYGEKVPICMSLSVGVNSHKQIELVTTFLNDKVQVSSLEVRVELQITSR